MQISGNAYEFSYDITGLNPDSVYTLTVSVVDALMNVQTTSESITSTPVFDWSRNDFRVNVPMHIKSSLIFDTNNTTISATTADGSRKVVLEPANTNGNTVLGYGNYVNSEGDTNVYGNNVRITTRENLIINGRNYGSNKVLWESTGWYMNATQVATLKEPISAQPNGIVLVFSLYRNGSSEDVSINSFFVSKKEVELLPGAPHTFFMMINSGFSNLGAKYLYIDDLSLIHI